MPTTPTSPPTAAPGPPPGLAIDIDIPPCPRILMHLLEESRRAEPDFNTMAGLVAEDPALAAAMLKTVNSPYYGLAMPARTLQQALGLLGIRKTVGLATGLLLRHALPDEGGAALNLLWESSSRTAAALACLARGLSGLDRDEAYTFGLFRDCGMLVLAGAQPDYAGLLRAHGAPHTRALDREEAGRFGTGHAQVGFRLAECWFLADELALAVLHHHNPAILAADVPGIGTKTRRLVAASHLADRILHEAQAGEPGEDWRACAAPAAACLRLHEDDVAGLAEDVLDALSGLAAD